MRVCVLIIVTALMVFPPCFSIVYGGRSDSVGQSGAESARSIIRNKTAPHPAAGEIVPDGKGATEHSAEGTPDIATLDDYVLLALKRSSELRSAFRRYGAALEKGTQVSSLPDPRLTYGYFIREVETRVGPQQHKFGVSQHVPWFGKLSLKGEIADAEAEAEFYRFLSVKNKLVYDVKRAYLELSYLDDALEITAANFELLKQWEQVLLQRFRSGKGGHAEVIKVQVELGKMEDRLAELREVEVPLRAEFNSLLNRENWSPVHLDGDVLKRGTYVSRFLSGAADLDKDIDSVLAGCNPELKMLSALIEAREKGIELSRKNFFPDFVFGLDYIFVGDRRRAGSEGGDDAVVAMLSLNLPIFQGKYRAGVRESESFREAVSETYDATLYSLKSRTARSLFDLRDSERRIRLFRDTLVPKAYESMESTYTAFESAEASFLDLLDAERLLLEFDLSLSRAYADFQIAESELERITGSYSGMGGGADR